jgi:hypothetical protein
MTEERHEHRAEALSQRLFRRGLAAAEVDAICSLVAYIDRVDRFADAVLSADLPLSFSASAGKRTAS